MKQKSRFKQGQYLKVLLYPIILIFIAFAFYIGRAMSQTNIPSSFENDSLKTPPPTITSETNFLTFTTTEGVSIQYPSTYSVQQVNVNSGKYAIFLNHEVAKNCMSIISKYHKIYDSSEKNNSCLRDSIFWESSLISEEKFIDRVFLGESNWTYREWQIFWEQAEGNYVHAYTKHDSSILEIAFFYVDLPSIKKADPALTWDAEKKLFHSLLESIKFSSPNN